MGRFRVVTPPFTVPDAPALLALCEAAAARQGQDVCPRHPAASKKHIATARESLHYSPCSPNLGCREGLVRARHSASHRARVVMALRRVRTIFDFPRASMSRYGRAHILSPGRAHGVRQTRYGARQSPQKVGRWAAAPSCGPYFAAATRLPARPRVHPDAPVKND